MILLRYTDYTVLFTTITTTTTTITITINTTTSRV